MQHDAVAEGQATGQGKWDSLFLDDAAFLDGYCSEQTKEELSRIDGRMVPLVREAAAVLARYLPHASHASPRWAPIRRTEEERDQGISIRPIIVAGIRGDDDRIWSPKVGLCHDEGFIYFFIDKFLLLEYEPQLIDDWCPWRAFGNGRNGSYLRLKKPVTKDLSESYYGGFLKFVSEKQHSAFLSMRARNRTLQSHPGLIVERLTPKAIAERDVMRRNKNTPNEENVGGNSDLRPSAPVPIEATTADIQVLAPVLGSSAPKESYLLPLLVENWDRTDLGRIWKIHKEPGHPGFGVGFPCPIGRIDILARHRTEPRWLVVALQGDMTSDAAVGQVLRHIGWVARHHAQPQEAVEGLVVGPRADPQLGYLMAAAPNVRFYRYEIDFRLIADDNHARSDEIRADNTYQHISMKNVNLLRQPRLEHSVFSKVNFKEETITAACSQFHEWTKRLPANANDEINRVLSNLPIDPRRATADQAWRVIWDKPLFANTRVEIGEGWVEELSCIMAGAWKNWGTDDFCITKTDAGRSRNSFEIRGVLGKMVRSKTSIATSRLFAIQNAAIYMRHLEARVAYPVAEFWTRPLNKLVPHLVHVLGWGWGPTTVLHMLSDFGVAVKPDIHVMNSLRRLGVWLGSANTVSLNDALLVNEATRRMLNTMGKVDPSDVRRLDIQLMALSRFKVPL
jgi:hypothetical protein